MKPKLLETIRRLGMSVEEAAQRAGISRSQLYNIQKGRRNLSSYRIATFAKAWGVAEHELVEFERYHENTEPKQPRANRVNDCYTASQKEKIATTKAAISADTILRMRKLVCIAIKARALRLSDEQIDLYTVQACDVFMATGFSALRPSFVDAFMDEVQAQQ